MPPAPRARDRASCGDRRSRTPARVCPAVATCIRIATVLVHTALVVSAGAGCAKPPAQVASAPPPVERAGAPSAVRTRRALCDGSRCWVSVELEGNRRIPSDDIFAAMSVLDEGAFTPDQVELDMHVLRGLYENRGYLEASIARPFVDRSRPYEVRITVSIDEGPQYRVSRIDVHERRAGFRCPVLGGFSSQLRPGDVYDRSRFSADLQQLQRTYRDQGYAKVDVTPSMSLDPERHEIRISASLVRGEVHSFGRVLFEGNRLSTPADLRSRVEVIEGARFSEAALDRSKARLLDTGLFASVAFSIEEGKTPATTDVIFVVDERDMPLDASRAAPAPAAPAAAAGEPARRPSVATRPEPPLDTRGCTAIPLVTGVGEEAAGPRGRAPPPPPPPAVGRGGAPPQTMGFSGGSRRRRARGWSLP